MSRHAWAVAALIAAIAFAASPLLFPGFGGFDPDLFPVRQENPPVQPAGIAFAIWGLLYAWLILSAGFGLMRRAEDPEWAPMRPWLTASMALGFLWLPLAQNTPLPALALILVMAVAAIIAHLRAGTRDFWLQAAPVGLYAGWLTAASGAAVGLNLAGFGLLGPNGAAVAGLLPALGVALGVQAARRGTWTYGAAVIWALAFVIVANAGRAGATWPVIALAAAGIVAMLAVMFGTGVTRQR